MSQDYKLIKKFPFANSPEIGYTSKFEYLGGVNDKEHYWNGNWFNPADYPEFWEKVVEKDYEILSFVSISNNSNNQKSIRQFDGKHKWDSDEMGVKEEKLLKDSSYIIYSVKRLSDNVIFTINDDVVFKSNKGKCFFKDFRIEKCHIDRKSKIISFKVEKDIIGIQIEYNEFYYSIDAPEKVKQLLFKTEDGVDIFEINTRVWYVDNDFKLPLDKADADIAAASKSGFVFFSTKEKAEDYIIMNKPCLSINNIINVKNGKSNGRISPLYISRIKELVKQKIK